MKLTINTRRHLKKTLICTQEDECTYLHCGFGHPRKGYEHFLSHVKARTQHTDKGEEDSDQQGDEQRGDTQACTKTHTEAMTLCVYLRYRSNY